MPAGNTAPAGHIAPAGPAVVAQLLGQFTITAGERAAGPWPRPTARRLCALLLLSPGHRVSRDHACAELFPQLEPRAAARALSKALSMARAALAELDDPSSEVDGDPGGQLSDPSPRDPSPRDPSPRGPRPRSSSPRDGNPRGPRPRSGDPRDSKPGGALPPVGLIRADPTHLWLAPGVAVDVEEVTAAVEAGLSMAPGQAKDDALSAALGHDAELLPEEPYADWADRARDQLNALRQEARLALARDRAKGAGRSSRPEVTAAWLACFDHDPASEEAAGALIRLSIAQGRPERAARVFERCRTALEQLGLRVSPSLDRLYTAAVARTPPSPASASRAASPTPPVGDSAVGDSAALTPQPQPSPPNQPSPRNQISLPGQASLPNQLSSRNQLSPPNQLSLQGQSSLPDQHSFRNQLSPPNQLSLQGQFSLPNQLSSRNQVSLPGQVSPLSQASPPGQVTPPREERRPVTMLFAEVAAPADLAARVGLEALRDYVGGSLAAIITEVEALGGTVTSISGRGLQAIFGAPVAHEDDPERALRAAYRALAASTASGGPTGVNLTASTVGGGPTGVNLVGGSPLAVTSTGATSTGGTPADGPPGATSPRATPAGAASPGADGSAAALGLRIGIESGPALVGPIGGPLSGHIGPQIGGNPRAEYIALGDVVSAAAAIQAVARPGTILVGPATRAVTAHLFHWGTAPQEVCLTPDTPDSKPLIARYLAAPRATAAQRRPRLGGTAPLIGRQAELRLLDTALRAAVAGRGQAVLLTGEPGLGKTRLVAEARNRFIGWVGAGSGRRPIWLEGRGVSYASATPYGVYRYLLAGWLGTALDQPPSALRAALADALTRLMGNTNLIVPLASLLGLPATEADDCGRLAPEEHQRKLFAAMRALVSRFAAIAPTVLVLEDLHWADASSLRLTAELAQLAEGRPLLLLATSRPAPTATSLTATLAAPDVAALDVASPDVASTGIAAALRARQISLRPLSEDAAAALTRSLIGQLSGPEVLRTVLGGADGNPLFVEERLADMIEVGTLVRQQGVWRLGPLADPAQPHVPQVLERLIRSRVDRLTPAAADAVRAAAVLGPDFTADVLAATLGVPPAKLAVALDELQAADLVRPQVDKGPVFRFRHALIQEAVSLALLRAERRDLHARAARALEAATVGRHAEVAAILGRHYAQAEIADRALHYLELAGDRATDSFANDEAIASFREALAVTEQAGDQAADAVRLQAKLANVLWRTARRDEARAAFRAALRLAGIPPVTRAHLYTRLGRLEMSEARLTEAVAAFDAAEALLADAIGAAGAAGAEDTEGAANTGTAGVEDTEGAANTGTAAGADEPDDTAVDQWLEVMIDGRADLHLMAGDPRAALAVLERVKSTLEARGGPARKTAFYRLWTMQKLLRRRLRVDDEDLALLRAGVAAAAHTGEEKDIGYATDCLGWALWLRGDLAAAAAELTKALAFAERIGETNLRAMALLTLCLTELRRHDVETVRALLPQAIAASAAAEIRKGSHYPASGLAVSAWLAWQDGRPAEVIRLAAEIERHDQANLGWDGMYRYVYLFPLLAAHLQLGELVPAVAAARALTGQSQQWLPDDLSASLTAADVAHTNHNPAEAARRLAEALSLARAHAYF